MQTPGERIEAFLGRNPHMRKITESEKKGMDAEILEVFADFMEQVEKLPKRRLERLCLLSTILGEL